MARILAAAGGPVAAAAAVETILQRDYLPHAIAGDPLNRSGGFTAGRPPSHQAPGA